MCNLELNTQEREGAKAARQIWRVLSYLSLIFQPLNRNVVKSYFCSTFSLS
uniref:Uncharacterized protein n=1 Tax=Arundo donax TaxID=35708 RepID=A0A0A9BRH0_ARUDO